MPEETVAIYRTGATYDLVKWIELQGGHRVCGQLLSLPNAIGSSQFGEIELQGGHRVCGQLLSLPNAISSSQFGEIELQGGHRVCGQLLSLPNTISSSQFRANNSWLSCRAMARFFWSPVRGGGVRVTTIIAPKRNYELKKNHYVSFYVNNLKCFERNFFFPFKMFILPNLR